MSNLRQDSSEPSRNGQSLRDALSERVLVADGAMGTMLQRYDLELDDFEFHEGCNEILNLTRPDVVKEIHDAYFEAGVQAWDIAAGLLMVREAGGKVTDYKGAVMGPVHVAMQSRQIVAGNLKVAEALQKTIVSSGYAASFNG